MKLWVGQTVSKLGSVVTRTACPSAVDLHEHRDPIRLPLEIEVTGAERWLRISTA